MPTTIAPRRAARGRQLAAHMLAFAVLGSITIGAPIAALAEGGLVTTTTITRTYPAIPAAYTAMNIYVIVHVQQGFAETTGQVDIYDITGGGEVYLGWASGLTGSEWWLHTDAGLAAGERTLEARFTPTSIVYEPSTSAPYVFTMPKAPVIMYISQPDPVEAHHAFDLFGSAGGASTWTGTDGTLEIWRDGVVTPICTYTGYPATGTCNIAALPVGTYQFYSKYSGTSQVEAGESAKNTVTVIPDVVHATGVGASSTTIYPYKDAYKDTVAIKGSREEPIAVTIKLYTPGGSLLKTVSIAQGGGAYSWAWNGRNSAGTIYAEGKYKFIQTLKDAAGTLKTVTSYVTLSKKKLVTRTTTIVKKGSAVTAKGTISPGSVTLNTTSGYALLKSGSGGWAGVGWEFTLPSAVTYKSMKFQIYAKDALSAPATEIAVQNFTYCGYVPGTDWDTSCFDHWAGIGNSGPTTAWYSTSASVITNRAGTKVRGMLSQPVSSVYAYKAQIVVTYTTLSY